MGKAKTRYISAHYKGVKIKRGLYEDLKKLAEEKGLTVPEFIELLFKQYTTPSVAVPVDCVARRARKGDKPLNVYYLICRDGAKAIVPYETLADLSNRFKMKIAVEE